MSTSVGTRRTTPEIMFRPRPGRWGIRQVSVSGRWDYYTSHTGHLVERIDHYTFLTTFQSGDSLRFAAHNYLDRPTSSFDLFLCRTDSPEPLNTPMS